LHQPRPRPMIFTIIIIIIIIILLPLVQNSLSNKNKKGGANWLFRCGALSRRCRAGPERVDVLAGERRAAEAAHPPLPRLQPARRAALGHRYSSPSQSN
jgi:hypothetical protein